MILLDQSFCVITGCEQLMGMVSKKKAEKTKGFSRLSKLTLSKY